MSNAAAPPAELGSAPDPAYKPKQKVHAHRRRTDVQKHRDFVAARARRRLALRQTLDRSVAHVLSMGGGVQWTACLLMYAEQYTHVVFADPGSEWPDTLQHLDKHIKPFCAERNIPFVTVRADDTLEEHCRTKHVIPTRLRRWCTTDYKVKPIQRWYRSIGATEDHPVVVDLGISFDEFWRASREDNPVNYAVRNYPLADAGITRDACEAAIVKHGWPVPRKSSCDFCPYVRPREFRRLRAERPDRFREVVALEENGMDFPHTLLSPSNTPLRRMLENASLDAALADEDDDDDDDDQHCTSGFCFT